MSALFSPLTVALVPVPGYQAPLAKAIEAATGLNTIAVGSITDPQQAEDIITSGEADLVALARAMLYDPRWAWYATAVFGAQVFAPAPYWRAPSREHKDLFGEKRSVRRNHQRRTLRYQAHGPSC